MKIICKIEDGKDCPKVICDHCEEIILTVGEGMVKYGPRGSTYVCHKGHCDKATDIAAYGSAESTEKTLRMWMELGVVLVYLIRNLEMNFSEESVRADMLSQI